MNILYITHVSSLYGANRSLLDIISSIDRSKFHIYVIGPVGGALYGKLRELKIKYRTISMFPTVHEKTKKQNIFLKMGINAEAIKRIMDSIKCWEIDIVHTNSSVINIGAVAALLTKKRHIWHIRELEVHYSFEKDFPVLDYYLSVKSEKIIFISKYVKAALSDEFKDANTVIYYNPICSEKYCINRTNFFRSDVVRILCCGIIEENKKQLVVVKAMKILYEKGIRNIELLIVGNGGTYAGQIKRYIEKHHMQEYVRIKPFCDDLSEYRKNSDIAVMSSVHEALGRVTIESMFSELVLIGAASGATNELIEDGYNGLKYNPDSECELAEKIEYVIGHKKEAVSMVKNAKKYALKKFDAKRQIPKLEKIYLGKAYSI